MASKAVTPSRPAPPALAPTPATTITADDIAVPRIYIANDLTKAVKKRLVNVGDIFLALSPEDDDPQVLYAQGSDDPGVLFHVLHVRKGKSWEDERGDLQRYDFDDPRAPADSWITYNYTLVLPEVDPDMPARLLLTKSGKPAATKINTILLRGASTGPGYGSAFRLTSQLRTKGNNEWYAAAVSLAEANPDHVRAAAELYDVIAPGLASQGARESTATDIDEPGI